MSYNITEVLDKVSGKFTCMVSFDGRPAEYWECESLDPVVIDETLTKVAEDCAALCVKQEEEAKAAQSIQVVDGQVVTK